MNSFYDSWHSPLTVTLCERAGKIVTLFIFLIRLFVFLIRLFFVENISLFKKIKKTREDPGFLSVLSVSKSTMIQPLHRLIPLLLQALSC